MACKDCYNNCGQNLTSDQCTKYTGEDIPLFDICSGDPISKLNEVIIEKLLSALDGTGILPSEVTLENCPYIKDKIGYKSPTLGNLLQVLIDNQCTLKTVLDLMSEVEQYVFDSKCLTFPVGVTNPTKDDLLQASINKICSLSTTISSFPTTYVKNTDLKNQVITIVTEQTGGSIQYNTRCVPYTAYEYYGSLSNFDNTGKGIAGAGYDKLYLCNGLNGTPDKRGRTAVGATKNVPGGVLDPAVDPTNPINPFTDYALKDKFGENYHKLTIKELAIHPHKVTDPGHAHSYQYPTGDEFSGSKFNAAHHDPYETRTTGTSTTGISVDNAGGDEAHNNRQPSIAAYYYMYIP